MYVVTAQRVIKAKGFSGSEGVPTFYLDESTQGIISKEHAKRIAKSILGDCECHISVEEI